METTNSLDGYGCILDSKQNQDFNGRKGESMIDEAKVLNERAIRNLKKLKNDEDAELAIKALRNQSVLDELLGQGLKIISSNGDISDFDKYFEK